MAFEVPISLPHFPSRAPSPLFFCLWVGEVGCVCITHTTGPRVGKLPPSLLETKCLRARRNPRQTSGGDAGEAAGGQTEEASVGISRPGTSKRVARSMGPVGFGRRLVQRRKLGNDNEWSDLDPDMSETCGRGRHRGGRSFLLGSHPGPPFSPVWICLTRCD